MYIQAYQSENSLELLPEIDTSCKILSRSSVIMIDDETSGIRLWF